MTAIVATSIQGFMDEIERIHDAKQTETLLMRGQSRSASAGYRLVPKAGRPGSVTHHLTLSASHYKSLEELALTQFKREYPSHGHGHNGLPANDWEFLSVAQHYGHATRLMDWTTRDLVALYFATRDESNTHAAAVYVLNTAFPLLNAPSRISGDSVSIDVGCALSSSSCGPFDITKNTLYFPPKISPRIINQCGLFMAFNDPRSELGSDTVIEISIPNQCHVSIRRQLLRRDLFDGFMMADMEANARENFYRIKEQERVAQTSAATTP